MQSSGRTPSSILRKRAAADEQNQRRKSLRLKGRRVSFAPDDELETMHLFRAEKNSPLPSQDTQPLAELPQNQLYQSQQQQHETIGGAWPSKYADQQQDQYTLQSPGMSPMSMELTNDTLQQQDGCVPFTENDSFTFNTYGLPAAAAGPLKDGTQNITDNVPGLSTLVEEDEDFQDTSTEHDGITMELTGNTTAKMAGTVSKQAAQPSPASSTRSRTRRSTLQTQLETAQAAATSSSPAPVNLTSPLRVRRGSSTGRASAEAGTPVAAAHNHGPPAPSLEPTPSPLRRITRSMLSPLASPLAAAGVGGGFTEGLGGFPDEGLDAVGGAGKRSRRSTLNRFAEQQNKWGFVPGEEDTMMLDMNLPGAGGLGDATLHHVYAENTGTGEIPMAVRNGQLQQQQQMQLAAPHMSNVFAGTARQLGGRRRSLGRGHHRASLAAEVIPEEPAAETPASQPSAADVNAATDAWHDQDNVSLAHTPGPPGQQQKQKTPGDAAPASFAAAAEGDGITANLLLDDRDVGGWSHVPLARASSGITGRGSVGSNMQTVHLRGPQVTHLVDNTAGPKPEQQPLFPSTAAAVASTARPGPFAAGGSAHLPAFEECTTKLLADSTAASACGVMGLMQSQRHSVLGGTIAGGAPVLHPAVSQPLQQQQQSNEQDAGFDSPALVASAARGPAWDKRTVSPQPLIAEGAEAAAHSATPVEAAHACMGNDSPLDWQMHVGSSRAQQSQQATDRSTAAAAGSRPVPCHQPMLPLTPAAKQPQIGRHTSSVAAAGGCGDGLEVQQDSSEPTLELAGAAAGGGNTNALEDATLEDFAVPPEMGGGEDRPITMPFSGALCSVANDTPGGLGSVARTPGGSIRQAQLVTFSDFCQMVDMQFLTHIRRGTSISVMSFQPSTVPQDISQALQLLSLTSSEVAVLEGTIHDLQSEMLDKRQQVYELEDKLGVNNPPVFATVQTARHTQLERAKHCLVLLKKTSRALTASSWKQLRLRMEQDLASKLQQQQADLEDQMACAQAKLQTAQQQHDYTQAFHADVLKKLAAEEAAQLEAAAARSRLLGLRSRLAEMRDLNSKREQRAQELQAQLQTAKTRCAEVEAESAALLARHEQLMAATVASPQPPVSRQSGDRLTEAHSKLEALTHLQGWHPVAATGGSWLLGFKGRIGLRVSVPLSPSALATGKLELLADPAIAGAGTAGMNVRLAKQLLAALVEVMQVPYNFQVPATLLPLASAWAELACDRAMELCDACEDLFMSEQLVTAVDIVPAASSAPTVTAAGARCGGVERQGWLSLTLIELEQQLKVKVLLGVSGLLAGLRAGVCRSKIEVCTCPSSSKAAQLQADMSSAVQSVLADAAQQCKAWSMRCILQQVCSAVIICIAPEAS